MRNKEIKDYNQCIGGGKYRVWRYKEIKYLSIFY